MITRCPECGKLHESTTEDAYSPRLADHSCSPECYRLACQRERPAGPTPDEVERIVGPLPMTTGSYYRKYSLAVLDELDIDNLACGRVTRNALARAVEKVKGLSGFSVGELGGAMNGSTSDRILADELNDMLQAAREAKGGGK